MISCVKRENLFQNNEALYFKNNKLSYYYLRANPI